jgi:ankyrin repeat protein
MGDLTSLIDAIKITKSLRKTHKWPYTAREYGKLLTRLEDAVHESIKRAQQHELDGSWREAEYLWRSIGMYASTGRPQNIRAARMESNFHASKFSNRMMGLPNLVALHERMGDFPQAEHEQEILIARFPSLVDAEKRQSTLVSWNKTLIRLYGKFQERVDGYEVAGLEKDTLRELASLSLLFRSIALECEELCQDLSRENPSVFHTHREGTTLLHLSASRGSLVFTNLLLGVGGEVDFRDLSGRTALHLAAREGHLDVVEALLISKADLNFKDENGYSPLHFASEGGHTAVMTALLDFGADVKLHTFDDGCSPLHLAIRSNREDAVRLLLARGSSSDETTALGKSTLHLAAEIGNVALVRLFLENGIEKDLADTLGIRPIHDAATVEVAQLLLDSGADAHSPDKFDETPLHSAAWGDDVKIVELLLEHKVNVNARDDQGRTPLHRAVSKGKDDIVIVLLENGADVNAQDDELKTPPQRAALSGKTAYHFIGCSARQRFIGREGI